MLAPALSKRPRPCAGPIFARKAGPHARDPSFFARRTRKSDPRELCLWKPGAGASTLFPRFDHIASVFCAIANAPSRDTCPPMKPAEVFQAEIRKRVNG